jgi:Tfp pilus assembly protein PilN
MRPVNLIPADERRGQEADLRSGPLAYIVVGALVAALVGVSALVLTGNQIAERKDEVVRLRQEDEVAKARATRLAGYTEFKLVHDQRVATVSSLANSRFDWERVMRELSLILPPSVWLTGLTATVTPAVTIEGANASGGATASLRSAAAGPALEIVGCATGHDSVASFVTALEDIDGVTRVGVQSSALPEASGQAESAEGAGGEIDCRTRGFITQFQLVAAFDAAPVPQVYSSGEAPPPVEEEAAEPTESTPAAGEG